MQIRNQLIQQHRFGNWYNITIKADIGYQYSDGRGQTSHLNSTSKNDKIGHYNAFFDSKMIVEWNRTK